MPKSKGQIQVEFLKNIVASGGVIQKGNFSIERGLVAKDPIFHLTIRQGSALSLQELAWTPELEEYLLLERPLAMETRDEEIERLANVLSNNLKSAEDKFGKDYAQAVFVEILRERPQYGLEKVLDEVAVHKASSAGPSYSDCRQFLTSAIDGLQNTAVLMLKYPNDSSTVRLIGEALAIVLDDRFHITLRKELFPKW